MLPRLFLLVVATGVVAVSASAYNTNDRYNTDYNRDPNSRYGNNPNYNTNYNPDINQGSNLGYNQNYNNDNYNDKNNMYGRPPPVYAKNETAIFCYVNGSRIAMHSNIQRDIPFTSANIDVNSCTHVIFAAATINPNTNEVTPIDSDFLQNAHSLSMKSGHNLKVLVSISANPSIYSNMAKNYRSNFISSVRKFVNQHNLEGVNIDWQWPNTRGGRQEDRGNYATLLKELKRELRHDAKILTAFISPERQQISDTFDFNRDGLLETVDYFILMALEMRGHNYQRIEHHAPVDTYQSGQTVRSAIENIRSQVSSDSYYKFILAIPFYGKRYQLDSRPSPYSDESPMNKPFTKQHPVYPDTLICTYNQACRLMADRSYRYGYDHRNESPYLVRDNIVIVYEDVQSVRAKTRLALQNGFGGVMAFSIDMDDFNGDCQNSANHATNDRNSQHYNYGSSSYGQQQYNYDRKYPLLHAIYDQVQRGNAAMAFNSSPLAIALAVICAWILKVNN